MPPSTLRAILPLALPQAASVVLANICKELGAVIVALAVIVQAFWSVTVRL